jgi:hypothetical protein
MKPFLDTKSVKERMTDVDEKICPENKAAFGNVYPEEQLYDILDGYTPVTRSVVIYMRCG